jgi:hypothetical protein
MTREDRQAIAHFVNLINGVRDVTLRERFASRWINEGNPPAAEVEKLKLFTYDMALFEKELAAARREGAEWMSCQIAELLRQSNWYDAAKLVESIPCNPPKGATP